MPKRQSRTKKLISTEIQGDDSYVVITMPTVQESRDMQERFREYQMIVDKAKAHVDQLSKSDDNPNGTLDAAIEAVYKAETALSDYQMNAISEYVNDWNWVGDDEKPLPSPGDSESIELLTMGELNYLVNAIMNSNEKKGKRG